MGEVKVCAACKKPITGQCLTAGTDHYHPECFVCTSCKEPITGPFSKADAGPICQKCVAASTKCEACGKPIEGAVMTVEGKKYHPECFKCADCKGALTSGFFKVDGKFVCSKCSKKGTQAPTGTKPATKCKRCGEKITGEYVVGQKNDTFHQECFVCENCRQPLEEFVVDESRRFTWQHAVYLCKGCHDTLSAKADEAELPKCCACGKPCHPGPEVFRLLDGSICHWACFKCPGCGKQEVAPTGDDLKTATLFRSKVMALKEGRPFCEVCTKAGQTDMPEHRLTHVQVQITRGAYHYKKASPGGDEVAWCVRLLPDWKSSLSFMSVSGETVTEWSVEGTYSEERADDKWTITLTTVGKASGGGPAPGTTYTLQAGKDATTSHEYVMCEGVKCNSMVGVPDYEMDMLMRPSPKGPAAPHANKPDRKTEVELGEATLQGQGSAGVMARSDVDRITYGNVRVEDVQKGPAREVPTDVPEGCYSLDDLQNPDVWKKAGLDAGTREMYLSDEAFIAVFGLTKDNFKSMPKWKRDQQKKEHGLF